MFFAVAIHQAEGQYVAYVPDLPELNVYGKDMADVIGNTRVAMIDYLQNLVDKGITLPKGQAIDVHLNNPQFLGYTWAIISLDSLRFAQKNLSYHLTLPKIMLEEIYDKLGSDANDDAVQAFMIAAISHALTQND